jgi:hypothetical protein
MDGYTVLVAWMPPLNPNGHLIHYTIYMKTMEKSRGQYTRQFRVLTSPPTSSGLHHHNGETNVFYPVQGLNEVQKVINTLLKFNRRSIYLYGR